jgi:hypothetical protein
MLDIALCRVPIHGASFCRYAGAKEGYRMLRSRIILAAVLAALSATGARAEEWCGYAARDKALIECGYSTASECENVVGKGGMCFIDPDCAANAGALGKAARKTITNTGAISSGPNS